MRIAILSATHFGDDLCVLVSDACGHGPPAPGPGHEALVRAIGHVDYLVLVGDALDFSIASYERTHGHAKVFFSALAAAAESTFRCRPTSRILSSR